jgi:hypothetical protein
VEINLKKLQLLFVGSMPYPAKSYVCLGGPYGEGKNGEPLLTPECINPSELAVSIDVLQKQLDGIKVEARRKYAAYEKQVARSLSMSRG